MIRYKNNRHGRPMIVSIGEGELCIFADSVDGWPALDCLDFTARYIEKLEEIVEVLRQSEEGRAIITYAEGKP